MRDDFDLKTKETLARRVGYRCSNPGCRRLTSGPRSDPARAVNIGVAAHVTAASPRGPRYDPALSPEERSAVENGIWLCQNCAKLIDNDPGRYTVAVLRAWKQRAEQAALREIEEGPAGAAVAPLPPLLHQLPADLPDFTGRQAELHQLLDHLAASICEPREWSPS